MWLNFKVHFAVKILNTSDHDETVYINLGQVNSFNSHQVKILKNIASFKERLCFQNDLC